MSTHDEFPFAEPVKEEKKWDAIPASKKDWFATIFIFLLPPFGLYFLWRDRVYWRRSGKTVVVSNGRKFILSIPAVIIMLIGVVAVKDQTSTVTDSSEAVVASNDGGQAAARQKIITDWLHTCGQAHDTYLNYFGTGDTSFIILGDRKAASCRAGTPDAVAAVKFTHPECAGPMRSFAEHVGRYRATVLQAQSYNDGGMKGMAEDTMDTAQAEEKGMFAEFNRCSGVVQ